MQLDVEMRNMTRDEGSIIRIRCEITGSPLPHYRWYKDNVPIENLEYDENHLNVRPTPWGSRYILKIKLSRMKHYLLAFMLQNISDKNVLNKVKATISYI